jgi:hypothetical protein
MRTTWDPTVPAVLAAIVVLVGTVAATGGIPPGQWRGDLGSDSQSVRLDVRLAEGRSRTRISTDVATAELDGFDAAAFRRAGAPLRLAWKRDAGTFVFEGEGGRRPGGKVHFEPDAAFRERWRALGFETLAESDFLRMAVDNVRLADAERLHELGYGPIDADTLVRLESEPGSMKWIEQMHAAGLRLELDDLFRLRSHGVTMDEVRAYQSAGVPLDIESLLRLHDHGIDPAYVKGLFDAGVANDDFDGIVRLHAHGVAPDYVSRLRSSGYSGFGVEEILRLHDQGVDPEYVRGLVASRLPGLSLDDIVRLHAHGVPADYVRAVVESGPGGRDADDVIRLHSHGVTANVARARAPADASSEERPPKLP